MKNQSNFRIVKDPEGNELSRISRCKDCLFSQMPKTKLEKLHFGYGWLCSKTSEYIPLNEIPESCPLEKA